VLSKDENFQISKHQSSLLIEQCDSLEIFNNIYISNMNYSNYK